MFKNYFATAFRNLWKNKFYSSINITGLSVGLAVGIMILIWVQDEFSYDRFHTNSQHIYKISSHIGSGEGAQVWGTSPSPVALFAKNEVPEVEQAVRIKDVWDMSLYTYREKKIIIDKSVYVDPSFFDVFDFKLAKGDVKNLSSDPNSVILTRTTAKKFFGDEDPVGKILASDSRQNFTVAGVLEDFPENSSLKFNMLFPMENYAKKFTGNGDWKTIDEDMGNYVYNNYLLLKPGTDVKTTGEKLSVLYAQKRNQTPNKKLFQLQSLGDMHLVGADGNTSAMQTVKTFLMVAILILLIACINYVNLSTARSMLRSKEVSVRKIIGAQKAQLFFQFIFESALLFTIGSILAIVLVKLLFPFFNDLAAKNITFSLTNGNMWAIIGIAIVGSLIVASIYPSLLLSSFKPIEALKGKISIGGGNAQFRKILVVTQFVFSVALIISTIVIGLQLKFIREKNLGYDREHVLTIPLRDEIVQHYKTVRTELLKMPGVVDVSSGMDVPIAINPTTGDTDWDGKPKNSTFLIHPTSIDEYQIPLFKMQMAAGKNFTGSKADSMHIILNETAVREAGIKDPVGKWFQLWDTRATIIGVVKDFNYASLKTRIEPAVFFYSPENNYRLFIKTTGKDAQKAITSAQTMWSKYSPDFPFRFSFVDDDYDAMYRNEQRTGMLFNIFAIVAILISCLGLFGLAAYTAQVKTKEIGIRKVLGATVANIIQLLAKDFIGLVLIALVIAAPLGWLAMHNWLQDFAFRINISWWIFLLAGVAAIVIALVTVSSQAIKAALANPIKSLKEE
ncbi:MAG: ABC transporter permease [Chitinophagaceae bacterium]|nr:ABC transporter permease [Chitinophagaceae bacterium]